MKMTNKVMFLLACSSLLAACGGTTTTTKTGEAYALCHGGSYVAGATVTVDAEGKATDATLGEICLPDYIKADETVDAAKVVKGNVTSHGTTSEVAYYKEVKFGAYTLTATVSEAGDLSYTGADFTSATVCEAYYKAVVAGEVTANGEKGIFTNEKLNKDLNGYGGERFDWKANRDATVAAFLKYGAEKCLAATQVEDAESGKKYWTIDGESTGATWTDFNKVAEGYDSYIKVLATAQANAK